MCTCCCVDSEVVDGDTLDVSALGKDIHAFKEEAINGAHDAPRAASLLHDEVKLEEQPTKPDDGTSSAEVTSVAFEPVNCLADPRVICLQTESGNTCFELDLLDGVTAMVTAIYPGTVLEWNKTHHDQAIEINDRIVEVNGVSGCAHKLVSRLEEDTTLRLVVQRPFEFVICIPHPTSCLGADLSHTKRGTTLYIDEIASCGLIHDWNASQDVDSSDLTVVPQDRIFAVNGISGLAPLHLQNIRSLIRHGEQMELSLFRGHTQPHGDAGSNRANGHSGGLSAMLPPTAQ